MNRTISELFSELINPAMAPFTISNRDNWDYDDAEKARDNLRSQMTEGELKTIRAYRKRYGALREAIQTEYKACKISRKIKQALQAKANEESELVANGEAEMSKLTPIAWVHNNKDKS